MAIAELQDSQGFFDSLPAEFSHLLSIAVPESVLESLYDEADGLRVWTTILAVCILKKQFADLHNEWTLIAKKAETYLKSMHIKNVKLEIRNAMKLL